MHEELESELRALGRTVSVEPVPDDLAERVLARIPSRPVHPVRRFLRRTVLDARARRRLVAVIIAALIAGLLLTPPVRAAVIEWLRVGGIVFQSAPAPPPGPVPTSPGRPGMIDIGSVDRARSMIDFPLAVPKDLGSPTRVAVSEDRRLVEMEYSTDSGPVLLSQFDASIVMFVKRNWDRLIMVDVNGDNAAWLPEPHTITYVDPDGVEHTDEARISGPTLAYETRPKNATRPVTIRLEGTFTQHRATTIAKSLTFP